MKRNTTNSGGARSRLAHLPQHLLAFAVLVVLCAAGIMLWLDRSNGEHSASGAGNATYAALAEQVAARVAAALEPYRRAASVIAADDRVREALSAADSGRLAALAAALAPALDGTLALRILPADVRDAELAASPPLTYASISLMRAAREDGKAPRIEAHLAGTDDEHLVVIEPVRAAAQTPGPLLGYVHLSVDPEVVRAALRDAALTDAYAEIRQGSKVRLASSGTAPPADAPSFNAAVGGTAFAVRIAAPGLAARPAADASRGPSVGLVAIAAVLLGGGLLLWRRRRPAVTSAAGAAADVVYQGAIRNILDGAHPGLEQLLPRAAGAARAAATEAGSVDLPRAHGDDVTRFDHGPIEDEDPTVPGRTAVPPPPEEGIIVTETMPAEPVPSSVFRSYDIRGIVDETLTEDGVYQIGRALAAEAESRGQKTVVVARDGRHSSDASALFRHASPRCA
jgi:phosphomannomutase/phosphoglucomutase